MNSLFPVSFFIQLEFVILVTFDVITSIKIEISDLIILSLNAFLLFVNISINRLVKIEKLMIEKTLLKSFLIVDNFDSYPNNLFILELLYFCNSS